MQNGTGTFIQNDATQLYMACYTGDETDKDPVFNPIGLPFPSMDVLSSLTVFRDSKDTDHFETLRYISGLRRSVFVFLRVGPP